jgi:hypothetical protein
MMKYLHTQSDVGEKQRGQGRGWTNVMKEMMSEGKQIEKTLQDVQLLRLNVSVLFRLSTAFLVLQYIITQTET